MKQITFTLITLPLVLMLMASTPTTKATPTAPNGNTNKNTRKCVAFKVKNIHSAKGTFWVAFYKDPNTFLKKETFSRSVYLNGSPEQIVELCDLDDGWYAVAAYQDLDNNGEMKFNFIGIPREPYGFSNGVKPLFSAPSFKQCQFYLASDAEPNIDIDLVNP